MVNKTKRYVWNKYTGYVIVFTLLGLILSGSSTLWVSNLVKGEGSVFINFGLLLGAFITSSIPSIFSMWSFQKSEFEGTKRFIDDYSKAYEDKPELLTDDEYRQEQEPWIINGSRNIIRSAQTVIYGSVFSVSALLVDAVTMSWVVDPKFFIGYAASTIMYGIVSLPFDRRTKRLAEENAKASNALTAILQAAWDNLVVGNRHNIQVWKRRMNEKFMHSQQAAVKNNVWVKIAGVIITVVTVSPILGVTVWLFLDSAGDTAQRALLLAIIPKQLQTITYFDNVSDYLVQWTGIKDNVKLMADSVDPEKIQNRKEPNFKILWQKLEFEGLGVNQDNPQSIDHSSKALDRFLDKISSLENGRITIRAGNGSGKSVLMNVLKNHLVKNKQADCYLLPPTSKMTFESPVAGSVGECRKIIINEVIDTVKPKYLLLDEWDANLDAENSRILSSRLEKLSKECCIIEIRHRRDEDEKKEKSTEVTPITVSFKERFPCTRMVPVSDRPPVVSTLTDLRTPLLRQESTSVQGL